MLDKQESILQNYSTNEIDNLYLNLLSVISENPDKLEIIQLKKDLGEKYKFFKNLPITLIVLGSKSSGKKSLVLNIINSYTCKSTPEIDFFFIREKVISKNILIVYENSENNNFQVLRKKDKEVIYCDETNRLEDIRTNFFKGEFSYDFDEIVIKIPQFQVATQIVCFPSLNEHTVSLIDNYLVNTSIPIFLYVCSFDIEIRTFDKHFDYLKSLSNRHLNSYFYLVMTKVDLFEEKIMSKQRQRDKNSCDFISLVNNLDKLGLKYIGLTVINNLNTNNKENYRNIFKFVTDFYRDNISILKMEYFKCLLRSSINKFYLESSRKRTSSREASNIKNFKEKLEEQLETKLTEFLANLPKTKKEIKCRFSQRYETFKEIMKKNDNDILKGKKYMNRMSFMGDHFELIKSHFDTFLKEIITNVMLDIYPNIQFHQYMNELCTEFLFNITTNYQVGSYVGIWSKDGVYSDIIEKLFERLKDNKSVIVQSCKIIFQKALEQNFTYLEFISKSGDLVKHLYKLIDTQLVRTREIEMFTAKIFLFQYFSKKQDEVSGMLTNTLKS